MSVPNRNADSLNESLILGDCRRAETPMKTYMRRTINKEAETEDNEERN